jgi:hypothetical protein
VSLNQVRASHSAERFREKRGTLTFKLKLITSINDQGA